MGFKVNSVNTISSYTAAPSATNATFIFNPFEDEDFQREIKEEGERLKMEMENVSQTQNSITLATY